MQRQWSGIEPSDPDLTPMRFSRCFVLLIGVSLACGLAMAQSQGNPPRDSDDGARPRRARPPAWTRDQLELFPADARELLVGDRPNFAALAGNRPAAGGPAIGPGSAQGPAEGDFRWSAYISADTVENEIKRQAMAVAAKVGTATSFKGGGYRDCRDAFSVLAVMFAIAAEHDDDPRWSDRGDGLAALLARAGANCKVGTDNSFREAAARSEDLAELIRGGRPEVPKPPADKDWSKIADRSPLMRRMELAQQERLTPLMASAREFSGGSEDALHEAEVVAALSEVMLRDGFPDADDEDYAAMARQLRDACGDLSRAADRDDYELARPALGRASQACSACHEDYRG